MPANRRDDALRGVGTWAGGRTKKQSGYVKGREHPIEQSANTVPLFRGVESICLGEQFIRRRVQFNKRELFLIVLLYGPVQQSINQGSDARGLLSLRFELSVVLRQLHDPAA